MIHVERLLCSQGWSAEPWQVQQRMKSMTLTSLPLVVVPAVFELPDLPQWTTVCPHSFIASKRVIPQGQLYVVLGISLYAVLSSHHIIRIAYFLNSSAKLQVCSAASYEAHVCLGYFVCSAGLWAYNTPEHTCKGCKQIP